MKRETGLRRTSLLTGALVAASLAGTIGVGVAAYASDSAPTAETSTSNNTTDNETVSPSLTTGTDDGGQAATSGGS